MIRDIRLLIRAGFNNKAGAIQAHPAVAFLRGRLGMRWIPPGYWLTRDCRKLHGTLTSLLKEASKSLP